MIEMEARWNAANMQFIGNSVSNPIFFASLEITVPLLIAGRVP